MWWTCPFWLLALVLIIPVLWLGGFTYNFRRQTGSSVVQGKAAAPNRYLQRLTGLRVAAVIAVIMGLAGTSVLIPAQNRQLLILLDVSASIGGVQIERSRNMALKIVKKLKPEDNVAVVTFAGEPAVLAPLMRPEDGARALESTPLKPAAPEKTDLQAALRVGYQLLKSKSGNRSILLFSDGHPTSGGTVTGVLEEIRNAGIKIYTIPVGIPGNGLTSRGLDLPETIHPGERIEALWKVAASKPQRIDASIKLDGRLIYRSSVEIAKGENTIPLALPSQDFGIHRVEVAAETSEGISIPQLSSGGLIQVSAPARILVVHGNSSPALGQALTIQGMQVVRQEFSRLPDTGEGLDSYAAVILDNVPAFYITENQQILLRNYVAGGGGLLVIGGDSSLGRGEYYASGLEDMLPVQTDTRQRLLFPRASILFVIDHSGSMSEMAGKTSKQMAAMQGVVAALKELNPQDEIGILTFDIEPNWVLHFTQANHRREIVEALSTMGEGGGTDMSAAIQEIIREFSNPGPIRRHVIILTDGLTNPGNFKSLTVTLRERRVTVSTVGIGEKIDEPLLRDIARWGEGRFYRARPDKIPRGLQKETVRITRDFIQEGLFSPAAGTPSAILEGLVGNLPPIKGYLITKPKNLANVYLEIKNGQNKDPLLVEWRYGNGRVAVFTSDSGLRWLAPWSGTAAYNRFFSQLVHSIERTGKNRGLAATVYVEANTARIIVEATGSDHRIRTGLELVGNTVDGPDQTFFSFKETAAGHYEAVVQLTGFGIQQFNIYEGQGDDRTVGWVWNPPGAEFATLGPDLVSLEQLSAATGGQLMPLREAAPPKPSWTWIPLNLQSWLAVAALLLFLVELGYRSVSLGQVAMARAVLASWWAVQVKLAELVRGSRKPEKGFPVGREPRNAMEAYRYLAERNRIHRDKEKEAY